MLVILTDTQILEPGAVCQGCLLASQDGQPRLHDGQPSCGKAITSCSNRQAEQYQCAMGFRLANIHN